MSKQVKVSKIIARNVPLDGVVEQSALPTFAIDLSCLSETRLDAEILDVAMLQTIAPIFRIVVLTDAPIYGTLRQYGWPVEHFTSPESATRLLEPASEGAYRRDRIAIIKSHYDRVEFLGVHPAHSIGVSIAFSLGLPGLVALLPSATQKFSRTACWTNVAAELRHSMHAEYASEEGAVVLTATGSPGDEVLIQGDGSAVVEDDLPRASGAPFQVHARFAPHSSDAFEAMIYVKLARSFGSVIAAVRPWREIAVEHPNVARWIDLGLSVEAHDQVHPYYAEHYEIFVGSRRLIWSKARIYAAARRIARDLAT